MSAGQTTFCPRCRHDVGGVRSAWREACPLHGTCPECGLTFRWGEAIDGVLAYPWWTCEDARGPGSMIGRSIAQLLIASVGVPWMARSLRLEHRIQTWRLLAGAGTALAVVLGLSASLVFVDIMRMPRATARQAARIALWPPSWFHGHFIGPAPAPPGFLMEVDFEPMGDDGDVRVLGVRPVPLDELQDVFDEQRYVNPYVLETSLTQVLQRDLFDRRFILELRGSQRVVIPSVPDGVDPIAMNIAIEAARQTDVWRLPFNLRFSAVVGVPLVLVLSAAAFMLLPISRRRARVQGRHLGRLAVYAAAGAVLPWVAAAAAWNRVGSERGWLGEALGGWDAAIGWIAGTLIVTGMVPGALAAMWWGAVAHWHLRMSHAWLVGMSVGSMTGLAAAVVHVFVVLAAGP